MGETGNAIIPILAPPSVVEKCNALIIAALEEHGLPQSSEPSLVPALKPTFMDQAVEHKLDEEEIMPMFWRIDAIRAWQLIDRRIDESVLSCPGPDVITTITMDMPCYS